MNGRARDLGSLTARQLRPVALLLTAILSLWPQAGAARAPAGRGLLLPIQDRVGDMSTAAVVEEALARGLAEHLVPATEAETLRPILRRMRIRTLDQAPPRHLEGLAQELGVDWFFTATLHESRSLPVPQLTVAAKIYRAGDLNLAWAGYESASGLDGKRWLGRGGTDSLEDLAREVGGRLARSLLADDEPPRRRSRLGRRARGFAARPLRTEGATLAVVPLDSLSERDPTAAGDQITDAVLAALSRRGATLVLPGLVGELQRRQGLLVRGEIDPETRQNLLDDCGAEHVLTGLVEVFEPGLEELPNPRVAVSLRLVDTADGSVAALDGLDHRGEDAEGLLRLGRIYSAGLLAYELTNSLLDGFAEPAGKQRSRR